MIRSHKSILHNQPSSEHNHSECVKVALGTAESLCTERGLQLTPIRHQVLALIWESHKAVKAYELLDRLKPHQQAAKPATIYRALDFLIEQGLRFLMKSLMTLKPIALALQVPAFQY